MDKLEIQQASGFPVQKKTFDFIQKYYQDAFKNLFKMYGDNLILQGVELASDGSRTAGVVVIDGEPLPFTASAHNAKVAVVETTAESVEYQGGIVRPAYKTRTAKCDSAGTINFSDLQRVETRLKHGYSFPNWTQAGYLSPCKSPGTYNMQVRIDEAGKCLIAGPFEIPDSVTADIVAVAQLPGGIKPRVRQSIQITPYIYSKQYGVADPAYSTESSHQNRLAVLFPFPVFGYVDTDGKIYADRQILGLGYIADKFGWINAIIDL